MALAPWPQFFLVRFPLAMLTIAVVAEGAATALSGVPLHRHNVDDLANAVLHDAQPYRAVLLGDSITHNVAQKFRIGDAGEVADLTTHANAGVVGSMFLLKRYLESGHRPQHVFLALSRSVLVEHIDASTFTYYVTSVFQQPYERSFLQKYYADVADYSWRPAAMTMTTRIGEPLFSLLRHPGDDIRRAPRTASSHPVLENYSQDPVESARFLAVVNAPTALRSEVRAVLEEVCELSHQYHFALHIIWAPLEQDVYAARRANGSLQRIDAQIAALFLDNHVQVSITEASAQSAYPYFDPALIHIRGEGWEQAYANQLTGFVHEFVGETSAEGPLTKQNSQ